jgi:hypothetical protein
VSGLVKVELEEYYNIKVFCLLVNLATNLLSSLGIIRYYFKLVDKHVYYPYRII